MVIVAEPFDVHVGAVTLTIGTTGEVLTVIVTSSKQLKSLDVHLKTFAPADNPFTCVLGEVFDVKFPVPETTLQVPVAGEFAAKFVDVELHID